MTIITQNITDIAGAADNTSWTFYTKEIRRSDTPGDAIISTKKVRRYPVAGVLTVELDPGAATVMFDNRTFDFAVPDTDSELWPLIAAAVGIPPGTPSDAIAAAVAAYLEAHPTDIVQDITPQLGGGLDLNGHTVGAATAADLTKLHGAGTLSGNNSGDQDLSGFATPAGVAAQIAAATGVTVAPLTSPAFTGTPTGITKTHVGLGNVDNTADTAKPVSTAQQTALDLKAPLASPAFSGTPTGITKTHVGLGNVDNTADTAKPVSTAQAAADAAVLATADTLSRAIGIRLQALQQGASVWSNLVADTHIHGGNTVGALDRPVSVSVPSPVTPGATNLLASLLPLAGSTLGTIGSGGVLPTGLSNQTTGAAKVLNAIDGDTLDITFTAQSGQLFAGGVYFQGYTPAVGDYLFAFTVECVSTTSPGMRVRVSPYNSTTSTVGTRNVVYYTEESVARRVVSRVSITSVNERFFISVDDIGTTDSVTRLKFSDFMLIAEVATFPVCGGLLGIPPYGRASTASADITVNIPTAGDHMVLVKTTKRGWIAARATLTAGSNGLAGLFPGASFTVEEVAAVPAGVWHTGDLDVIEPPDWHGVRYHNGASNVLSYPRSYADISEMISEPITDKTGQSLDRPYAQAMGVNRCSLHRFETRGSDWDITDILEGNTNNRAEVGHSLSLPYSTDVWISEWIKIDNSLDAGFAIFMQIRQFENVSGDTSTLSPMFSFNARPSNKVTCVYRTDGGTAVLSGSGTPAGITTVETGLFDYVPGQWHRSVLKVNVSDVGGGNFSWWWDGVQIVNNAGPLGYDRDRGPLVRHGIYRASSTIPLVVSRQHLEITTTSLASRVTAPLPI